MERYAGRETGNFICVLGAITRNLSLDRYRKLHTAKRGKGEVEFIFDELTDQVDKKEPSHYIEEQELSGVYQSFPQKSPEGAPRDVCAEILVF